MGSADDKLGSVEDDLGTIGIVEALCCDTVWIGTLFNRFVLFQDHLELVWDKMLSVGNQLILWRAAVTGAFGTSSDLVGFRN